MCHGFESQGYLLFLFPFVHLLSLSLKYRTRILQSQTSCLQRWKPGWNKSSCLLGDIRPPAFIACVGDIWLGILPQKGCSPIKSNWIWLSRELPGFGSDSKVCYMKNAAGTDGIWFHSRLVDLFDHSITIYWMSFVSDSVTHLGYRDENILYS